MLTVINVFYLHKGGFFTTESTMVNQLYEEDQLVAQQEDHLNDQHLLLMINMTVLVYYLDQHQAA